MQWRGTLHRWQMRCVCVSWILWSIVLICAICLYSVPYLSQHVHVAHMGLKGAWNWCLCGQPSWTPPTFFHSGPTCGCLYGLMIWPRQAAYKALVGKKGGVLNVGYYAGMWFFQINLEIFWPENVTHDSCRKKFSMGGKKNWGVEYELLYLQAKMHENFSFPSIHKDVCLRSTWAQHASIPLQMHGRMF